MATALLILALTAFLAYANGANDNFKGVATLLGSGTAGYGPTLAWGTVTTFAGSMTALLFSQRLIAVFSGKGLVADELVGSASFVAVVAFAAAGTVLQATWLSFPISTTHALMGALVGAGLAMAHSEIHLAVLGRTFLMPLLLTPVAAMALTGILYPSLRWLRLRLGIRKEDCICVSERLVPVATTHAAEATASPRLHLETCQARYSGAILSVDAHQALNLGHFLTAGAVSFARGLNDTPKIVALLLAAQAMQARSALLVVAVAMALGAVLQARKVADTMARGITSMNHGQGFTANLVTAGLVLVASRFGMPVSTTHVSCGSLFGLGACTGQAHWHTISTILLAWFLTLPVAAGLAVLAGTVARTVS